MCRRRGQASAKGAGTLLIVLAVMILIYLLLIPDADREELLGQGPGVGDGNPGPGPVPGGQSPYKALLLQETPGRINPPAPDEVEHSLPSFTIFTATNAMELERKASMQIKNGIFSDFEGVINFRYDPSDTSNPLLSFNVKRSKGPLIIRLNAEEIYNSELNSGSPPPIRLPESLLRTDNELEFKTTSSGFAFWSPNQHELANVIVSGDVTDRSGSMADQQFTIPQREYEAMEFAELSFLPNCDPEFAGRMRISVNSNEVFSGFVDCGVPNRLELAKELMEEGSNTIRFVSQQGQYLLDSVKITSKIQGQSIPVYYFNLPGGLHEALYFNNAILFVTIRFADFQSQKLGVLNINGFEATFNVNDLVYQTQINPEFLVPGPNSIMLIPQGPPLEVAELRVETV